MKQAKIEKQNTQNKNAKKEENTYMKNENLSSAKMSQNSKNGEKPVKNAQNFEKNQKTNSSKEENFHANGREKLQNRPKKIRALSGAVIGLTIATSILGASTIGLGVAYGVTQSQANEYGTQIENIYKKNYFELVDNINNADMKISKLLASSSGDFQAKMLTEIAQASFGERAIHQSDVRLHANSGRKTCQGWQFAGK